MSTLPQDFFENENWKLAIRPVWIRKNKETELCDCPHCDGVGSILEPDVDTMLFFCRYCNGAGELYRLKQIEPAPDLSDAKYQKFLESLQKFINDFCG